MAARSLDSLLLLILLTYSAPGTPKNSLAHAVAIRGHPSAQRDVIISQEDQSTTEAAIRRPPGTPDFDKIADNVRRASGVNPAYLVNPASSKANQSSRSEGSSNTSDSAEVHLASSEAGTQGNARESAGGIIIGSTWMKKDTFSPAGDPISLKSWEKPTVARAESQVHGTATPHLLSLEKSSLWRAEVTTPPPYALATKSMKMLPLRRQKRDKGHRNMVEGRALREYAGVDFRRRPRPRQNS